MPIRAAGRAGRGAYGPHIEAFAEDLLVKNYSLPRIKAARQILAFFARFLKDQRVRDVRAVSADHVSTFARYLTRHESERLRSPLSIATRRNWLGVIRSFFAFLEARDVVLRNPAADLALPKVHYLPRGVLSAAQARKLMDAPSPWTPLGLRDRAMLETFYGTGIRLRECLNLGVADLDLSQGLLIVRNGKGRKDRIVPVIGRAAFALDVYLRESRPHLVRDPRVSALFLSMRGRRLSQSVLSETLNAYGREAGIPWNVSPHVLRHTCATHLLKGGADVRHVQRLLGHERIETTAIYTRVAIQDLTEAVEKAHPRDRFDETQATAEVRSSSAARLAWKKS